MKKTVLLSFFSLFVFLVKAQKNDNFPKSWIGSYKGNLEIHSVDSIAMKIPMQLDIKQKTDSIYSWKITYIFKEKEDIRNYELKIKNTKKGIYQIDEKNSILIDTYYHNKIFTGFFEVMQNFIITTYTKNAENIIFEIISVSTKNPKISGNKTIKEEKIPEVKTFPVNGRQKAVLTKQL